MAVDDSPQFKGVVTYNLACHYALSGGVDKAIDTLRDALALSPTINEYMSQDEDLAVLRDDPRFRALVAAST